MATKQAQKDQNSPAESPSTDQEATSAEATSTQADGNDQPTNAGLQADGSQPENGAAQVDGSPEGSDIPEGPVLHTAGTDPENTVVIGLDDELDEATFKVASGQETFVEVAKDVVETFYYPGTKRPAQRILFTKGSVVPKSAIDAYNAATRARKDDPNALENYVDSTTIASGTGANR